MRSNILSNTRAVCRSCTNKQISDPTTMSATAPRNPPFRAEHLGSLLRPKELLKARNSWEAGTLKEADLAPTEDEAVKKIVKVQLDNGFRAISDGEYRYASFWCHVLPSHTRQQADPSL